MIIKNGKVRLSLDDINKIRSKLKNNLLLASSLGKPRNVTFKSINGKMLDGQLKSVSVEQPDSTAHRVSRFGGAVFRELDFSKIDKLSSHSESLESYRRRLGSSSSRNHSVWLDSEARHRTLLEANVNGFSGLYLPQNSINRYDSNGMDQNTIESIKLFNSHRFSPMASGVWAPNLNNISSAAPLSTVASMLRLSNARELLMTSEYVLIQREYIPIPILEVTDAGMTVLTFFNLSAFRGHSSRDIVLYIESQFDRGSISDVTWVYLAFAMFNALPATAKQGYPVGNASLSSEVLSPSIVLENLFDLQRILEAFSMPVDRILDLQGIACSYEGVLSQSVDNNGKVQIMATSGGVEVSVDHLIGRQSNQINPKAQGSVFSLGSIHLNRSTNYKRYYGKSKWKIRNSNLFYVGRNKFADGQSFSTNTVTNLANLSLEKVDNFRPLNLTTLVEDIFGNWNSASVLNEFRKFSSNVHWMLGVYQDLPYYTKISSVAENPQDMVLKNPLFISDVELEELQTWFAPVKKLLNSLDELMTPSSTSSLHDNRVSFIFTTKSSSLLEQLSHAGLVPSRAAEKRNFPTDVYNSRWVPNPNGYGQTEQFHIDFSSYPFLHYLNEELSIVQRPVSETERLKLIPGDRYVINSVGTVVHITSRSNQLVWGPVVLQHSSSLFEWDAEYWGGPIFNGENGLLTDLQGVSSELIDLPSIEELSAEEDFKTLFDPATATDEVLMDREELSDLLMEAPIIEDIFFTSELVSSHLSQLEDDAIKRFSIRFNQLFDLDDLEGLTLAWSDLLNYFLTSSPTTDFVGEEETIEEKLDKIDLPIDVKIFVKRAIVLNIKLEVTLLERLQHIVSTLTQTLRISKDIDRIVKDFSTLKDHFHQLMELIHYDPVSTILSLPQQEELLSLRRNIDKKYRDLKVDSLWVEGDAVKSAELWLKAYQKSLLRRHSSVSGKVGKMIGLTINMVGDAIKLILDLAIPIPLKLIGWAIKELGKRAAQAIAITDNLIKYYEDTAYPYSWNISAMTQGQIVTYDQDRIDHDSSRVTFFLPIAKEGGPSPHSVMEGWREFLKAEFPKQTSESVLQGLDVTLISLVDPFSLSAVEAYRFSYPSTLGPLMYNRVQEILNDNTLIGWAKYLAILTTVMVTKGAPLSPSQHAVIVGAAGAIATFAAGAAALSAPGLFTKLIAGGIAFSATLALNLGIYFNYLINYDTSLAYKIRTSSGESYATETLNTLNQRVRQSEYIKYPVVIHYGSNDNLETLEYGFLDQVSLTIADERHWLAVPFSQFKYWEHSIKLILGLITGIVSSAVIGFSIGQVAGKFRAITKQKHEAKVKQMNEKLEAGAITQQQYEDALKAGSWKKKLMAPTRAEVRTSAMMQKGMIVGLNKKANSPILLASAGKKAADLAANTTKQLSAASVAGAAATGGLIVKAIDGLKAQGGVWSDARTNIGHKSDNPQDEEFLLGGKII